MCIHFPPTTGSSCLLPLSDAAYARSRWFVHSWLTGLVFVGCPPIGCGHQCSNSRVARPSSWPASRKVHCGCLSALLATGKKAASSCWWGKCGVSARIMPAKLWGRKRGTACQSQCPSAACLQRPVSARMCSAHRVCARSLPPQARVLHRLSGRQRTHMGPHHSPAAV